jgi:hypothetical protein
VYLMNVACAKLPQAHSVCVQLPFPFSGTGIPHYFQTVGCCKESYSLKIVHFFSAESTLHFKVRLDHTFGAAFGPPMDVLPLPPYNEKSAI